MPTEEHRAGITLKTSVKSVDLHFPSGGTSDAPLSPRASKIRSELRDSLKIPSGFVAGAGHQPIVWHAGILAKFVAASSVADAHGPSGQWIHFLSDQDVIDPFRIDLPARDRNGSVRRSSLRLTLENSHISSNAVPFARPAQSAIHLGNEAIASPAASAVLDQVIAAINRASDAPNAGVQMARAMLHCANRWVNPPTAIVESRSLLMCDAAREILQKIFAAPEECAVHFNAALKFDSRAARPLRENGLRSEVPVWGVREDGCRERIDAVEAQRRFDRGLPLLPRAFLASGLMRLTCDLFFHGTGGVRYERVGERWWRDFLDVQLPDFGSATATIIPLPSDLGLNFDPHTLPLATWREAWWDPTRLDRAHDSHSMIEPTRAALLQRIADAPRKSRERRADYRALCDHINSLRQRHSTELASLELTETKGKALRTQRALANDRTWPFGLMRESSVDLMATAIRDQIPQGEITTATRSLPQKPRG